MHPGYGFLSERAHFARAVEDAGLTFIGPPAAAIERLGSKTGARRLMESAGVPVVPGETPADQSDAALLAAAARVGFPLLVKPAAGGGGIGMKAVRALGDLPAALGQARREAAAAFGDGTLYVERLIERPRHVEVQMFGDRHGTLVHLFERECSAQRRHQKVIEETPCPALTPGAARPHRRRRGGRRAGPPAIRTPARSSSCSKGTATTRGSTSSRSTPGCRSSTRSPSASSAWTWCRPSSPWPAARRCRGGRRIWPSAGTPSSAASTPRIRRAAFLPQAGPLLRYREPSGPGVRVDAGVVEGRRGRRSTTTRCSPS